MAINLQTVGYNGSRSADIILSNSFKFGHPKLDRFLNKSYQIQRNFGYFLKSNNSGPTKSRPIFSKMTYWKNLINIPCLLIFSQHLYHRICQRTGVGGQEKQKSCQRSL